MDPTQTVAATRPSWEARMVMMAQHWSQYSTCLKRQVGAVIFEPISKAIVSIGYNDTPIGSEDCGSGGCKVCRRSAAGISIILNGDGSVSSNLDCWCVHAEQNAVFLAARRGGALQGCHIALAGKDQICIGCKKMLIQVGIEQAWTTVDQQLVSASIQN